MTHRKRPERWKRKDPPQDHITGDKVDTTASKTKPGAETSDSKEKLPGRTTGESDSAAAKSAIKDAGTGKSSEMSNGAKLTTDKHGRPVELHTPDNRLAYKDIKYDAQGKVTSLSDKDGQWTRQDGDNWKNTNGAKWKGEISVDEKKNAT